MHDRVIITCAVTGNITTRDQNPALPATPEEIARACLDAATEGAAIVHIHVRDPRTAAPSTDLALYREVVDRVRGANPELILNVTTGPGGRFRPSAEDPKVAAPGTTLMRPELRVEHIVELRPEICTLDLNTMNSGEDVVINTPGNVRKMAAVIGEAGVKPEIELFDTGDIQLALDLIDDGTLATPSMFSIVTGVKYGFPSSPDLLAAASRMLPPGSVWTGFGLGRMSFPMMAQSWLLGGHARVGMEDNVYLGRGVPAPDNAALVRRAREILERLGARPAKPDEAREILRLR
ncbi:MAG: 3-keto-5-aminohexanoate cleavage protein [Pseudomonadota bacterium]